MRTLIPLAVVAVALVFPVGGAEAQNETSIDIGDVGSSRIGGPGLTKRERAVVKSWDEPEEYLTEESLPPPGHKKRMQGLHTLANRYVGGQMWKDACGKYETIVEEGGDEAVALHPEGKKSAGKAFLQCGKIAFAATDYEKAEKLLSKSEKFTKSDYRHRAVRRKIIRETYRKKVSSGDISGALKLFNQYQAEEKNDDERIWFGEQLSRLAWNAHDQKDEITRDEMMRHLESVAPMNTEYRKLRDEMHASDTILGNAIMFAAAAIGLVFLMSWFTKWRARAKVGAAGSKNKFDLDDDL